MPRQYVGVKFRTSDERIYTYHNNSAPVLPGDKVRIAKRKGGESVLTVNEVGDTKPAGYDTKPILGRAEPESNA